MKRLHLFLYFMFMVPYIVVITWIKRQLDVLCFKILKILFTLFRSTCFGRHCVHHQELLSCTCSLWSRVVLGSLCSPVLLCCNCLQHSRTGGHNEPSTTRDQRLHVQLRSSWWWTQWRPKHVERNNVNEILRILKQSTSSWHFYSSYYFSMSVIYHSWDLTKVVGRVFQSK